jgi:uncharacterized protein (TIGR02147 family)
MLPETNNKRPCVFEYADYRAFLGALYLYFKEDKSYFSYRYFSQKAGFSSPNFLKLVVENKRNLSLPSIEKFAKALKLSKIETEFFSYLVQFNQADSESKKSWFAQKMVRCQGFRKIQPLKQAEYSYYANWYYIPIRELICVKDFKEDALWIAKQFSPALSVEQVERAIAHLQELKLVLRNSKGQLIQSQKSLTTENEVSNNFVKQYHKDMIQKGSEAIDNTSRELREISSVCIPVSEGKRDEIKKLIQDFRKEVMALAEEDENSQAVYQLNIQWFPIAGKR